MATPDFEHIDEQLRDDVRALGNLLGFIIAEDQGSDALADIETVRALAKDARAAEVANWSELSASLAKQNDQTLVTIARAFNQFLNLANIAEQAHVTRQPDIGLKLPANEAVASAVAELAIELVLTAHPTEVLRRTMIQKYDAIEAALGKDAQQKDTELQRLITEAWYSDEIRKTRPTPQDEAKWGFAVIESSLWQALPDALRHLDAALASSGLPPIPLDATPLRIATWMGGDRDGNPNVTALVTEEVLMLGRWMAADLFLRDLENLQGALSMTRCNDQLRSRVGDASEPYRAVVKTLRDKMLQTRDWAEARAANPDGGVRASDPVSQSSIFWRTDELLQPLQELHDSLVECGMAAIAAGPLQDTIRRAAAYGPTLTRLDIRQSSDRHADAFDELTRYLNVADDNSGYNDWSEAQRCEFLLRELDSKRPLFPATWPASAEVSEVLDTCALIARLEAAGIAQYVISMARHPSDVLAVILLLRDAGLKQNLPIVPLFETLDDLERAPDTLNALLSNAWYANYCSQEQQVMIGYSDSAKDAGQFAAAWAQYEAQEQLVAVADKHQVKLTLFHGRGGAVGRGGGPSQTAIRSQPPNSVNGRLRVTEQGEMIRWKLGTPELARNSLTGYISATLESSLNPPDLPRPEWREAMRRMAARSLSAYRATVRDDPGFVGLFRALTPERELGILALGSRPARRAATDDVASLRAIPWVFAWTQIRLMLPAWLGTERALGTSQEELTELRAMLDWPFFRMQIDMLEMVLAKCEPSLTRLYATKLLGDLPEDSVDALCDRLAALQSTVLKLRGEEKLLTNEPALAESLTVRNTYLDPLHVLQAELLARYRADVQPDSAIARALRVTMAGISSGLRNTG
ncbi:MAG: phosphoenolpyruvate carboxylase [Pseudomonadaceae bacterium]|nr:phosphoenolpyruvate carboxylase [Pseudomonadaceae bacterium]